MTTRNAGKGPGNNTAKLLPPPAPSSLCTGIVPSGGPQPSPAHPYTTARKPRRASEANLIRVFLSPFFFSWRHRGAPKEWGLSGLHQEPLHCPNPFAPRGLCPRKCPSEGMKVAPYRGGCYGHQWNQVEINEMALNVGKGDLRGLSPARARPASKPRPFLAHPRKSRSAPCPAARGRRVPARRHPGARRVRPGRAQAPRRPARAPARGRGAKPSPASPGGTGLSGWSLGGSGAPSARSEFFGPRHPRVHSKDATRKALGTKKSPSPRKPRVGWNRIPTARCLAQGRSPLGRGSPCGRQHKHSSVLYSPPN